MNEIVERAAKALAIDHYAKRFMQPATAEIVQVNARVNWHLFKVEARLVLEMSREPTDAMIEKAIAPYAHGIDEMMRVAFVEAIRGYWTAMIDEALREA